MLLAMDLVDFSMGALHRSSPVSFLKALAFSRSLMGSALELISINDEVEIMSGDGEKKTYDMFQGRRI